MSRAAQISLILIKNCKGNCVCPGQIRFLKNMNYSKCQNPLAPSGGRHHIYIYIFAQLVFIPGTPTDSPISTITGHNHRGRRSPSAGNRLENDEHLLRDIEKRTISRLQQSWL